MELVAEQKPKNIRAFLAKCLALYLVLAAIVLACDFGVCGYRVVLNITPSVKGWVFIIDTNDKTIAKGKLISVHVPVTRFYPHDPSFIKYVWGVTGDTVRFDRWGQFYINDEAKGIAKPFTSTGIKLDAAEGGIIPAGKFFGATPHPDSFDSRYKLIGNLDEKAVIGRAIRVI